MTRCWHCFARVNDPALVGPDGRADATCHECGSPVGNDPSEPATFVVMAGPRRSGKSVYIPVMLEQLKQYVSKVRPADERVAERYKEHYYDPLYVEGDVLKPTTSAVPASAHQREPLRFVLTGDDGNRHHLVIRDVAGEDLEYLEQADTVDRKDLCFFRHADAVLFLYDPGALPAIRAFMADTRAEQRIGGDPLSVLERTIELMQGGSPRLAVVMAKFDIVHQRAGVEVNDDLAAILRNLGAAFGTDASPLAPADDAESEFLHEEIRSLLLRLDQRAFLTDVRQAPGEHRFFAVSALGESPHGEKLDTGGIVPFRCLDPLRWVLAGTGMLPRGHHEELAQKDRFGFTVVEPVVPEPPKAEKPPPPPPSSPSRRWQRLSWACLLLAFVVAATLGIAGFQTYNTVDVTALDPVAQARTWAYVLLGGVVLVPVVIVLAAVAAVVARPRATAVIALVCAIVLPVGAAWAAHHFGTRAMISNAASDVTTDPRFQQAVDILESWRLPVGGLRG